MQAPIDRPRHAVGTPEWWQTHDMVDGLTASLFLEYSLLDFIRQFFYIYFKSVPDAHDESDNTRYQMFKEWYTNTLPYYNEIRWTEPTLESFINSVQTEARHEDVLVDSESKTHSEFKVGDGIGGVFQTSQKTRPKLMEDLWRYHRGEQQGNRPETYRRKDIMYMLTSEILRSAHTVRRNNELCIHYGDQLLTGITDEQERETLQRKIDITRNMNENMKNVMKGVKLMAFFVKVFVREIPENVNGIDVFTVQRVNPAEESIMRDIKPLFYDLMSMTSLNTEGFRSTNLTFHLSVFFDSRDQDSPFSILLSPLTFDVEHILSQHGKDKKDYFCSQSYMKYWWNKLRIMKLTTPENAQEQNNIQSMYRYANNYYEIYNKSADEWMARKHVTGIVRPGADGGPRPAVNTPEWWQTHKLVNPIEAATFLEHSLLEFLRQFFYLYFKSIPGAYSPDDNVRYQLLRDWYLAVLPYYDETAWRAPDIISFINSPMIGSTHEDVLSTDEDDTDHEFPIGSDIGDAFQTSQKTRPKLMRDLWHYNENNNMSTPPESFRHEAIMSMLTSEILRSANTVHKNNNICLLYFRHVLENMDNTEDTNAERISLQESIRYTDTMNIYINNLKDAVKMIAFFVKVFVSEAPVQIDGIMQMVIQPVDLTYANVMTDLKNVFYGLIGLLNLNNNHFSVGRNGVHRRISELNNMFDKTVSSGVVSPLMTRMEALMIDNGTIKKNYFCSQSYMKFWWNKLKIIKQYIPADPFYNGGHNNYHDRYGVLQQFYRYANLYWHRYNKSPDEWMARTDHGPVARPGGGGGRGRGRGGGRGGDWVGGADHGHGRADQRDDGAQARHERNSQRRGGRGGRRRQQGPVSWLEAHQIQGGTVRPARVGHHRRPVAGDTYFAHESDPQVVADAEELAQHRKESVEQQKRVNDDKKAKDLADRQSGNEGGGQAARGPVVVPEHDKNRRQLKVINGYNERRAALEEEKKRLDEFPALPGAAGGKVTVREPEPQQENTRAASAADARREAELREKEAAAREEEEDNERSRDITQVQEEGESDDAKARRLQEEAEKKLQEENDMSNDFTEEAEDYNYEDRAAAGAPVENQTNLQKEKKESANARKKRLDEKKVKRDSFPALLKPPK